MVQPNQSGATNVDGVKGWLIVMVTASTLKLIVDNYLSYGIVVNPITSLIDFGNFVIGKWWLSGLLCVCCFQQILHMYLIEKSIILNLLSEKIGMTLHALNCFFVGLAFSVISHFFNCSYYAVFARLWMFYISFTFTKCWSFSYVNMEARRRQHTQTQASDVTTQNTSTQKVQYPENVKLVNIISYMVFTPPVEYQLEFKTRMKWNINVLPIFLFKTLISVFTTLFIAHQYMLPELAKTPLYISQGQYLHLVQCFLRIMVPVNIIWLIQANLLFRIYLPAYAEIVGMNGIIFQHDWWNAENMGVYWPKWNVPMFVCFKNNFVKPLLQMGYSRNTANAVVAIYSGLMHEISLAHSCGVYSGMVFLSFVLQIPARNLNVWIAKRYGKGYGNIYLWFSLCIPHTVIAINIFNSMRCT